MIKTKIYFYRVCLSLTSERYYGVVINMWYISIYINYIIQSIVCVFLSSQTDGHIRICRSASQTNLCIILLLDIEILCIGIGNPRKTVHRRAVSEGVVHTRGQCRDMWCLVDVRHDDDNTGQQLATYSRAVTCVNRENCIRKVNSSPSTLHHEGG